MFNGVKDRRLTSTGSSSKPQRGTQPGIGVGGERCLRDPRQPVAPSISAQHRAIITKRSRTGGQAAAGVIRISVGNTTYSSPSHLAGLDRQPRGFRLPDSSSSRQSHTCAMSGLDTSSDRYYIRIENEFQLRRFDERPPKKIYEHFTKAGVRKETVEEFLNSVVALYNRARIYPSSLMALEKLTQDWWPGEWTIAEDWALMQNIRSCEPNKFWGVEMGSPKFWASPDSNWVNQVKQTWSFLQNNYEISKSLHCGTRVHVSIESGFDSRRTSLQNLKKIAQCVIHFESAVEACVPEERRSNRTAKSNWIDNTNFAHEKLTRRKVIDIIEKCDNEKELIELMCPGDRYFAWNFRALRKHGTIEFRKGAASLSGDVAIAWAQLVLQFVESAVQVPRSSWERIPANVKGLKRFLGTDPYGYLHPILKCIDETESAQPGIVIDCRSQVEMQMLERKLKADKMEQLKSNREKQA